MGARCDWHEETLMVGPKPKLTRTDRRLRRIRRIPLVRVLALLGYDVDPSLTDVEQQFRCNLHGDGSDGKPSARTYPQSPRFYCFACSRSRDAVDTYRERAGVSVEEALDWLEKLLVLAPLSFEETEEEVKESHETTQETFEPQDALVALDQLLSTFARARSVPLSKLLGYWSILDRAAVDDRFAEVLRPKVPDLRKALIQAARESC